MCGFIAIAGNSINDKRLKKAINTLNHRGPDAEGIWHSPSKKCALAHKRLKVIDLTEDANQPMIDQTGRYTIVFNGEIYNYLELREELKKDYKFKSKSDTEVLLAAYSKWKETALDKLIGMFAFAIWDEKEKSLFACRDRFGVKPLYYTKLNKGKIALASEIKAIHALGLPRKPNDKTWATYLAHGLYNHNEATFWEDVRTLLPGHAMLCKDGNIKTWKWYDLSGCIGKSEDARKEEDVIDEYKALLKESISLRFRSDVPVGINLSGGLDSSILLRLTDLFNKKGKSAPIFTFITGDKRYDELPWVKKMLKKGSHSHYTCMLKPKDVPDLAGKVQWHQDEPFGGLPTLAYANVFESAKKAGVTVLLDGQGLDEQWAGYDYYAREANPWPIQGTDTMLTRPKTLIPEFCALAEQFNKTLPFQDKLRNLQYRDIRYSKLPRAMRFNDRISMMHSTELREPFLDHRLFELALRQPRDRKIQNGTHKWLLRKLIAKLLPKGLAKMPKHPVQTPQREWLRGPLREWAGAAIKKAIQNYGNTWLDVKKVKKEWETYQKKGANNSFYIWQWINIGISI